MKNYIKTGLLCGLAACGTFGASLLFLGTGNNTIQQTIAIAVTAKDSTLIQFPELYNERITEIPYGGEDTLHLGHELKNLGFEQINYGWGNAMAPAVSLREAVYEKSGCKCEVTKIYYDYSIDNKNFIGYDVKESIRCCKTK